MIVASDNAKQPLKGGHVVNDTQGLSAGSPSRSPGPAEPPPPAYGTYQVPQSYPTRPYVITQFTVGPRESPAGRFWRAFIVAVCVWFLMSIFVRSTVDVARWNHGNLRWTGTFPVPSDVALDHCVHSGEWSTEGSFNNKSLSNSSPPFRYPLFAETSFDLPLSAANLFLLARGPRSSGNVKVEVSSKRGDTAKVHLSVKYFEDEVLDSGTKVCLISRANNETGVGIFTRRWMGSDLPRHTLYYEINLVFPNNANVQQFQSDMPNTSHRFGDLQGSVNFQNINVRGSNAHISVESLHALTGNIHTSNGAIEGHFSTSRSLILETSNAPINVDVRVHHDAGPATELTMVTSNGKLDSNVNLVTSSKTGGKFSVSARTSNSPLHVNFPTAPVDSTLRLAAATSNSPASVSLHPTYEGTFELSSSLLAPAVNKKEVDDPSGKGRKRSIDYSSIMRGMLKGKVSWSNKLGSGSVTIRTSNSRATLEL